MRKIVLLSLDAMAEADVSVLQRDSFLAGWMSEAAVCTQVKTVFPALTYPAHTTLVTGTDPSDHGIGQNQPFQPEKEAAMRAWYWDAAKIRGDNLFSAVKRQGGRCASILWPVTGKHPDIRWNFPEVLALPGENQVLKMLRYGSTGWILHMEWKHGRERISSSEPHLSDYATVLARDVIRSHQPELTAVHLVDLDDMRHHHGVNSREARDAMNRNERRVQAVWETMRKTPGMEDALLVLVSDHGQADVSRTVCITELLKTAGLSRAARVQSNGMSAYLFPGEEGMEGLRRAKDFLNTLGASDGVAHVYSREELDTLGCVPTVGFAVEAAPEVVFSDGLPQAKREKATHGFGPSHPAENCLMAVRGRGIRPCRLPAMPMRDVAPTLAGLMGVRLKRASGEDHSDWMK